MSPNCKERAINEECGRYETTWNSLQNECAIKSARERGTRMKSPRDVILHRGDSYRGELR